VGGIATPLVVARSCHYYRPSDGRRIICADAINRTRPIDEVLHRGGEPASPGGLAPSHALAADGLTTYEHNLTRAARLLEALLHLR
jgi:hypothetical protein